ncbi:MAG: GDP-mannose 4,6-dehydratase [Candidatus Eremiobacteraeota bacterium]|nr:GDP-mannose 4,6-dehydratase [Candidatus Eremiobacteraeota bacterium]
MRALVTGAGGFVGRFLVQRLRDQGHDVFAAGGPREEGMPAVDVLDPLAMHALFDLARPDAVFHLAAQAFVPQALRAPGETYAVNITGTANVLAAMREWCARAKQHVRLIFTSSGEVYGAVDASSLPLRETVAPNPGNPYAASKAAAEAIVRGEVRSFGVDAILTRAFNHIGPGQDTRFAVASFASQLAGIARGGDPVLHVGNLDSSRDFLDVRDVVEAYVQLAERGRSGETYNVCSGSPIRMREMLRMLIEIAHVPVHVRDDPERMRPSDVPVAYGDNTKLRRDTGWSPKIPLRQSLQDVYAAAQAAAA